MTVTELIELLSMIDGKKSIKIKSKCHCTKTQLFDITAIEKRDNCILLHKDILDASELFW